MKVKHIIVYVVLFLCCGCWQGYSVSNQTNEYAVEKKNITKILVLPPEFLAVKDKESSSVMDSKTGYGIITKTIQIALKDIKMDYTLVNDSANGDMQELFKYIIPLKAELIKSSGLHDNPFERTNRKTFTKKLFARSPKIDPKYCKLADKYGTNYVMFVGIYTNEKLHYQYVIIADLAKSEIVFRNLKFLKTKARKSNIEPVLYDTFYSIRNY